MYILDSSRIQLTRTRVESSCEGNLEPLPFLMSYGHSQLDVGIAKTIGPGLVVNVISLMGSISSQLASNLY